MYRRRAAVAALLALVAAGASAPLARAATCGDPSAQNAFHATLSYDRIALGRRDPVTVAGADGVTYRSGDWNRPNRATVTPDDPAATAVVVGAEDVDAWLIPSHTGTIGATVAWTQTSDTEVDSGGNALVCQREEHVTFEAVAGRAPPATVLGARTGDYERNSIGAGLTRNGCHDSWQVAIKPVVWALHWTTSGRAPGRGSRTLTWRARDACSDVAPARMNGPRRVANRTFVANRLAFVSAAAAVSVIPALHSHGIRGWWEVTVGGQLVKSTRFKWVYGTGHRVVAGHSFPITGVTLQHDSGPCPGLPCSAWTPFPGF
jgi:hypothetical protein